MREDTNALIDRLAREAQPVKPLSSPWLRAGVFLAGVVSVMAIYAAFGGHVEETIAHMPSMPFAAELVGAVLAGAGAIVAAVVLSIPGRAHAWTLLPLPGIALWLFGGGLACYRQVTELGYVPTSLFASSDCFTFIVTIGVPTAIASYLALRRSLSLDIVNVAALAGLGAALLAAALLQFIHAHGTNPVDFGTHIVAVVLLTALAMTAGRALSSSASPRS
jgi:hypothetical protein